jgi:hypothetical protein
MQISQNELIRVFAGVRPQLEQQAKLIRVITTVWGGGAQFNVAIDIVTP